MKKIFLYFDQKFKKEYLKKTVYEQNDQEKKTSITLENYVKCTK